MIKTAYSGWWGHQPVVLKKIHNTQPPKDQHLKNMPKVLFLYLKAFSFTGGIEKFNRNFLKALHELSVDGCMRAEAYSMYDTEPDRRYFPQKRFRGFGGKRLWFVWHAITEAQQYDTVVLGHINLAIMGIIMQLINPHLRLILIAHGLEVWQPQKGIKKKLLTNVAQIYCVSHFTRGELMRHHSFLTFQQCVVFPNTLDAYFTLPPVIEKPADLVVQYGITDTTRIILTVTRLQSFEKYKGYDTVIRLIPGLLQTHPHTLYYIIGKADASEQRRIEATIRELGLEEKVKLLGFVPDELLQAHYVLADVFIMPSHKEGFGIVFIEAMACGLPVIAGNKDGSRDALLNGKLGTLVDPDDPDAILQALQAALSGQVQLRGKALQLEVWQHFSFEQYKQRLKRLLGG